jgi:hypothetical protein
MFYSLDFGAAEVSSWLQITIFSLSLVITARLKLVMSEKLAVQTRPPSGKVRTTKSPSVDPSEGPDTVKNLPRKLIYNSKVLINILLPISAIQKHDLLNILLLLFENNFLLRPVPDNQISRLGGYYITTKYREFITQLRVHTDFKI